MKISYPMPKDQIPNNVLKHNLKGRRSMIMPRKRWTDEIRTGCK
jgi:hypothetical protein